MNPETAPLLKLHQLALYNTGRMPPEQVIATFAVRQPLLDRILADLSSEKSKSRAQHHLIIGQRGMGKTMLLARIAAELNTNPDFSNRFIPLVFAEEQYSVDRLSKFWLNSLDSLADAYESEKNTQAVDEIDEIVQKLSQTPPTSAKNDNPIADEAYKAFASVAQTKGRRPVLLVDNLQIVFQRLEKEQQHSLRELLMRPGSPILIGASPSPPEQSTDYAAAFYDQFKTHYLHPLNETEMRDLLTHLASIAGRDDVRQRVLQHPARLKVLRQLTGGNPRTTLTLFFLYAEDFAPSVFGDLEGLLDRVTPLYKARFEELTDQQQVITSAIANHWDPVTAATLAKNTAILQTSITPQLDRLVKLGTIERVELFGESRTGFQIAERFFNIWFLMRSASRRQRREVEFLTRFLESFYEPTERTRIANHLMSEELFSPDRCLWSRALADNLDNPETAEDLKRHTELLALREAATAARKRLHELIDFNALPPATLAFDEMRKKLMALVPVDADITPKNFSKAVLGDRNMFENSEREQLASRTDKLSSDELHRVLDSIKKSRIADIKDYSEEAVTCFSKRLASGQIRNAQDAEDWNRAFHQADGKECIELMANTLPDNFGVFLDGSSINRIHCAITPKNKENPWKFIQYGYVLHTKLAQHNEAETAYRRAITLDPENAIAWNNLAALLQTNKRYDKAQIAYQKAVEIDPEYSLAWNNMGSLLATHLQQYDEAEKAYRRAVALDPENAHAWGNLGKLLQDHLKQYDEAITAYRKAIACKSQSPHFWNSLGNLYCDYLNRFPEAIEAFKMALILDPFSECVRQNQIFLHRDFLGEGSSAQILMEALKNLPKQEYPDSTFLHEALFAAYDANWGLTRDALAKAIAIRADGFSKNNTDDWLRASAVLIHLNYGEELLRFLDERGETARLRPWVEAVRAVQIGDKKALQNIAPEIRTTAEELYDGIEHRLRQLPESTSRRPVKKPKRSRKR